MACSKRSLCKQVACEWDMIVALSEIRLEVCFFSLNERLNRLFLLGKKKKKKQVAKIFPRFGRKISV